MFVGFDEEARLVVRTLTQRGYEAYFVGGCVRDTVLNRPIQDIDIATSALPEQVMACFPRTAPTGLQHGTVTVIMKNGTYEVTTFRKESLYEGYRRPAEVAFISDLTEDLRRRDFTMNAMAMDDRGMIVDPFGGQKDLAAGILRCVGQAEERFGEDALRMLRCVRFASAYGLEVEAKTWSALLQQAPLLQHIAMERVRAELQRMAAGTAPARAVRLLLASRLWRSFKRQLGLPFERWLAHPAALDAVSALESQHTRWVLLLLLLETPADKVRAALQELTFSRADTDAVVKVLGLHEWLAEHFPPPAGAAAGQALDPFPLERIWKLGAVRHGIPAAKDWLLVMRALLAPQVVDRPPHGGSVTNEPAIPGGLAQAHAQALLAHGEAWLAEIPCATLKELAVTGAEVIAHIGKPAGPWTGKLLQQLLEQVALGDLPNEREALLRAASK
jgi:tRNA nucleotidyltransferase (CCA-adding enzyme)